MSVHIRDMQGSDLPVVYAIESKTYPRPWSIRLFTQELQAETSLALVAEEDDHIVGYLIADMFIDVWHLMNIAVDEDYRRRHIASGLMEAYFEIAERRPHRGHTLEVRVSNEAAIDMYRSFGFISTGVRPRYYDDNGEDALIMWRDWEGDSA
jgi:[ribosomal protein S18]-alanine N-acetyltransferase